MTSAAAILAAAAVFTRPLERVSTMDPVMAQSAYDQRAARLVYESVLSIDYAARPYRVAPGACELPEFDNSGLVCRLRVRSAELSAEDVVESVRRLGDPANASPNAFMVANVRSASAIDAKTVELRLKARQHVLPWMLTYVCVRRADGSGTGPFHLAEWRKNHIMRFVRRRPGEAKGPPRRFDEVRYLVVDDVSTQWLMFLKGEIDMLGEISRDNWDSMFGRDGSMDPALVAAGVTLRETPTLDVMYVGVNMKDTVLGRNRKLRQALNCAFDFPAWRKFYNGRVDECTGPVPAGVEGRLETPFAYSFNLDKARRLLEEAGYPGGIDRSTGRRLSLVMSIGRANQDSREAGELMASFYAKVGVSLELDFKTWDAFLKAMNEGRVQLFRIGWVGDYPDAENFLQLFHSRNVSPGANHCNFANPEFDREYDAAMAAPTAAERNVHWARCQEIVREDCPWIFTHCPKSYSLLRARVGNYVPGAFPYGNETYYEVIDEK